MQHSSNSDAVHFDADDADADGNNNDWARFIADSPGLELKESRFYFPEETKVDDSSSAAADIAPPEGIQLSMKLLNRRKDQLTNLHAFLSSFDNIQEFIDFLVGQKVVAVECWNKDIEKVSLACLKQKKVLWALCGWEVVVLIFEAVEGVHSRLAVKFQPHWLESYRENRLLRVIRAQKAAEGSRFVQHLAMSIKTRFGFINIEPFGAYLSIQTIMEQTKTTLPREFVIYYMGCVTDAMMYMHSKGIVHRDLKTDNVVIQKNSVPKIIDFGLAKTFPNINTDGSYEAKLSMNIESHYCSPESYRNTRQPVDQTKMDIWNLGYFMLDMLIGSNSNHLISKMDNRLEDGWRLFFCKTCKKIMANKNITRTEELLCEKMMNPNPRQRSSFKELRGYGEFRYLWNYHTSVEPPNIDAFIRKHWSSCKKNYLELIHF